MSSRTLARARFGAAVAIAFATSEPSSFFASASTKLMLRPSLSTRASAQSRAPLAPPMNETLRSMVMTPSESGCSVRAAVQKNAAVAAPVNMCTRVRGEDGSSSSPLSEVTCCSSEWCCWQDVQRAQEFSRAVPARARSAFAYT